MKNLIASLVLLTSTSTAIADTYSQQKTDCSKDKSYFDTLNKDGFEPIINTKDLFISGLYHMMMYNTKTHQVVVLSVKDKKDVCLEFTGNEVDITPNLPVFRDMLDNSILDTIKNSQSGKDD